MSLYPFIGLNDSGELRVYVSPFKLNKLSPMHGRGKPFPVGSDDIVQAMDVPCVLKNMMGYFNEYENNKRTKKK